MYILDSWFRVVDGASWRPWHVHRAARLRRCRATYRESPYVPYGFPRIFAPRRNSKKNRCSGLAGMPCFYFLVSFIKELFYYNSIQENFKNDGFWKCQYKGFWGFWWKTIKNSSLLYLLRFIPLSVSLKRHWRNRWTIRHHRATWVCGRSASTSCCWFGWVVQSLRVSCSFVTVASRSRTVSNN